MRIQDSVVRIQNKVNLPPCLPIPKDSRILNPVFLNSRSLNHGHHQARPHQRLRQDRHCRIRQRTGRLRRRDPLHRRHRQAAARRRSRRQGCLRVHRLPGDARRPGQDPAPQGSRRPARHARQPGARGHDAGARHRADRHGGGQPLPLRGDRGQGRLHPGGRHREHRHRRPDHAALGGQEQRRCHRAGRSGRLRAWSSTR